MWSTPHPSFPIRFMNIAWHWFSDCIINLILIVDTHVDHHHGFHRRLWLITVFRYTFIYCWWWFHSLLLLLVVGCFLLYWWHKAWWANPLKGKPPCFVTNGNKSWAAERLCPWRTRSHNVMNRQKTSWITRGKTHPDRCDHQPLPRCISLWKIPIYQWRLVPNELLEVEPFSAMWLSKYHDDVHRMHDQWAKSPKDGAKNPHATVDGVKPERWKYRHYSKGSAQTIFMWTKTSDWREAKPQELPQSSFSNLELCWLPLLRNDDGLFLWRALRKTQCEGERRSEQWRRNLRRQLIGKIPLFDSPVMSDSYWLKLLQNCLNEDHCPLNDCRWLFRCWWW